MIYYVVEQTNEILPDGNQELRFGREFLVRDEDGTALANAKKRFYADIVNELSITEAMNGTVNTATDFLHTQSWYIDKEHSMIALHLQAKDSEILRAARIGVPPDSVNTKYNIDDATLIGEAIVENEFEDVYVTRERLYRTPTGVFIMETSRQTDVDTLHWDNQYDALTVSQAQQWAKKHINPIRYKRLFGAIIEDTDRIPVVTSLRKDIIEATDQYTATTGKQFALIVEEALIEYLKKNH